MKWLKNLEHALKMALRKIEMLKIFAKYKTDEKAAIYCDPLTPVKLIMERLKEEFGGDWVMVDEVMTSFEILKFNDGQDYLGFEPSKPNTFRYSSAITHFKLHKR